MGAWLAKYLFGNDQFRVLMLGLDAAGKTQTLYKLKLGEVVATMPTIGFNVEQVEYKNASMTVWDVGGQDRLRPLWRHYFQGAQGLVFVVDSADTGRLDEARLELSKLLAEPELERAAILVFANKQDLPGAATPAQLAKALALTDDSRHRWHVQPSVATTGEGLYEGLDWLRTNIRELSR